MPSGYTVEIANDISFEDFVLRCARAFGSLVTMRDEPLSKPIPKELKPNKFYGEELTKASEILIMYKSMSIEEANREAKKLFDRKTTEYNERTKGDEVLRRKYESMLSKVKEWEPPTDDHNGLKDFMIKQIEESIEWDCGYSLDKPKLMTGEEYLDSKIEENINTIEYYNKKYKEELKRVEERNEWIRQLRNSLQKNNT